MKYVFHFFFYNLFHSYFQLSFVCGQRKRCEAPISCISKHVYTTKIQRNIRDITGKLSMAVDRVRAEMQLL